MGLGTAGSDRGRMPAVVVPVVGASAQSRGGFIYGTHGSRDVVGCRILLVGILVLATRPPAWSFGLIPGIVAGLSC